MDLVVVLGLGLLLGMQHATDVDHLAAVATLATHEGPASRSLPRALRLGAAWGLGHTLTLLVVAGAVAGLGWIITDEAARRFEQGVGLLLVVLGFRLAWRLREQRIHFHGHAHPGRPAHFHGHSHAGGTPDARRPHVQDPHRHEHRLPMGGLVVGMVHGLAGSAALALLAGAALPSPGLQLAYIALFGAGSLLGMALLTGALAVALRASARRLTALHGTLNMAVAGISVVIGAHLMWSSA